jgi:Gpi18-like mannosyltransferase/predicted membrane-bound dolichyl-phosphate-mannose-protein mannosyltransferase
VPSPLATATAPASALPWVLVCALLFVALCALAWRLVLEGDALSSWSKRALLGSTAALLLSSLALRLGLATAIVGVPTDIACFKGWAMAAAEGGLSRFYAGSMFVDYPPGYIYVLKAVGHARLLLGLGYDSPGFLLLVKLPAILLDLAAACLVLWIARSRLSLARACALSVLVAFNPAAIHNSAVYGQVDVFLAVSVVLALAFAHRGALLRASAVYTAAVLLKPQALLLAPVALLVLVKRRSARTAGLALLVMAATLTVLLVPFTVGRSPAWIVDLYARTLGSYPYATLNAANLYALVGDNWAPVSKQLLFLSYGSFGAVCLAAIVACSAWLYLRSRDPSSLFIVALFVVSSAFFLATRMHERYLYPAVLIAAATYAVTMDPRLFILFAGFSVSAFLNEAVLQDLVARTGSFFIPPDDVVLRLLAALNLALVAYAVKVAVDRCAPGAGSRPEVAPEASPPARAPGAAATAATPSPPLSRRDYLLMGGLTLAYAAVAFTNLGALGAPQTCWSPSRAGETSYLDLGAARNVGRILYFMGLGQGGYTLELSVDGQQWSGRSTLEQATPFEKLEWRTLSPPDARVRYLRITTDKPGAALCEVAAFEGQGRAPVPLVSAPPPGVTGSAQGTSATLADEQGTVAYDPSFLTGMYFDEIFHARAAYEILHRLEPTETTHPPLGKTIIALGVAAFGMTPFGWRFMGTLFGVAMVPLLYLFAHRLFGRTELAFLAGLLFALDFMHFVQTRIATIDSYGVFFVILMFFFLHEYVRRDFWRARLRDLLFPLLCSGIAFALGAASKWSALYGGAGLALILSASLALRGREYARARRLTSTGASGAEREEDRLVAQVFPRRALAVLGWCALSFVVVPAILYLLAYVPFMLVPGPGHGLREVLAGQAHMYRYHAGMTQAHPFSSPWWQWPMMWRPAWYYQGSHGLGAGMVSSIVAMGNPAIWWPGIAAVVAGLWLAVRRGEASIAFVLVGLFSQLAPWGFAPRKLVFIYHFFPSVPFVVLAIVYAAKVLIDRHPAFRHVVRAYCVVVLGLFALFYPILSAMPVRREFVLHWLRWFDSWIFC